MLKIIILILASIVIWYFSNHNEASTHQEIIEKKMPTMDIAYEKAEAKLYLNTIRTQMNMTTLQYNTELEKAAQAHANYLVANDTFSHNEIEGTTGFTGTHPYDRALAMGYATSMISENLSTKNKNAKNSIDGLFSAIYHRFAFLNPSIDEIGIGIMQDTIQTNQSAFVYMMGNSTLNHLCKGKSFQGTGRYIYGICKDPNHRIKEYDFKQAYSTNQRNNPKLIIYPYNNQTNVPPAFYEEIPDPLPDYQVSGFPISIMFNEYFFQNVKLYTFKLFTKDGHIINNVRFMDKNNDPNHQFTDKQYALFPLQRLEYDTTYIVKIEYEANGKQQHYSWSFHTQKPQGKLYTITQKEEFLTLKPNVSYVLYFRPFDGSDFLKDIEFPTQVSISFVDNNTIRLEISDHTIEHFDIRYKDRVVHINIKEN